jgi:23S rRNA (adenine2503-C2)-methyltransferase
MPASINIRSLTLAQVTETFREMDEPAYRARQVWEWLWQKSATSFEEMTNLSKALRQKLAARFCFQPLTIDLKQVSTDGTVKVRFLTHDGHRIEGVLIPTPDRFTACVSSQVGCSLSCKFCATGFLKRERNLEPWEIYDQFVLLNRLSLEHHQRPLTNIVFMGMGEPLLNYKNVLDGIERLTAKDGLDLSPKRITVSTAGIAKMIRKLGDDGVKFNLALSLHATTDAKRDELMPINEQNNLEVLIDALNYFYEKTHGKITFEYILLAGQNDTIDDAKRLAALCQRVPAKVNVIEYNPISQADFSKTEKMQRDRFLDYLEKHRVTATFRRSRGRDIDAACGQLANT